MYSHVALVRALAWPLVTVVGMTLLWHKEVTWPLAGVIVGLSIVAALLVAHRHI